MMKQEVVKNKFNFTSGKIYFPLIKFAIPVFIAVFLQALYGAVDLLVIGEFADTPSTSGVGTGSMFMQTVTMVVTGFATAVTVLIGKRIGEKKERLASKAIGSGILLFGIIGLALSIALGLLAPVIAVMLKAPAEAYDETVSYLRICGIGAFFIVSYNVIGSIFRGIGDSKMPLITVLIAAIINIFADLLFIAVFHMDASGAALATVLSQAISVIISLIIIMKRKLPFVFYKEDISFNKGVLHDLVMIGSPIAFQELLVGISFMVVQTIVNGLGLYASSGIGVAEKTCGFLMLVPSAFMQAMSAFVAQNVGAGENARARKALLYSISTSFVIGVIMFYLAFFHGDMLARIFTKDANVIPEAQSYLKAYAIDCLLTPILFCFFGFYNGYQRTMFVMIQGIIGAFGIRIPIAFLVSHNSDASLFHIGLATPASTVVQIGLCLGALIWLRKQLNKKKNGKL